MVDGLAVAAIWLGAMFWVGLGIDYLPVVLGANEMPWGARLALLLLVAAVLLVIAVRWIFSRLIVRMQDRSMALLVERQFAGFRDSLVTAVELAGETSDTSALTQEMLVHSQQQAVQRLDGIRLGEVFDWTPLVRKSCVLAALGASLLGLRYFAGDGFALAFERLYLLSGEDWPRSTEITVDGFEGKHMKIARGSDFSLRVFADAEKYVPDYCTVYYDTEQGDRGRVHMRRRGQVHQGRQEFIYDGMPFKSILSSVKFDVLGFDHRVKDYQLQVVESPSLTEVLLDCTFPDYLLDEELGVYLARTEKLVPGTRLPEGTRIHIRATADKPLRHVDFLNMLTGISEPWIAASDGSATTEFTYDLTALEEDVALAVTLHDVDHVSNKQPFRILIGAVADALPQITMKLQGIGSAITPQAVIPVAGRITDDNAVDEAWFHILQISEVEEPPAAATPDASPSESQPAPAIPAEHRFPIPLARGAEQQHRLDLRKHLRDTPRQIHLKPGQRIALTVRASDRYDLDDTPRVGSSDVFDLEIVTADQLISRLETAEITLRRRLRQVVDDLHGTRDSVVRVRSTLDNVGPTDEGAEPEDEVQDGSEVAQRTEALRLLRVQRAAQDVLRSKEEVFGIGLAFDDIRAELINNRVDTTERIEHLQRGIADPLKGIVRDNYPPVLETLQTLESALDDPTQRVALARTVIQQLDELLLDLEHILKQILDLESYNELIDIVRSIIKDQEHLIDETEKQRDVQGIELLE